MKQIPFGKPLIGEEEKSAVIKSLESSQLVHGPFSSEFEMSFSKYIGSEKSCTTVASATAGLYLAYLVLGIGPGDEVIVTSLTHVATANAVIACGAEPVFVDVDIASGNIDYKSIRERITRKTKAISVVHFLGNPVNMSEILSISGEYNLRIVEDCALALGAKFENKHVGLFGDFGVFSFYPAKHITTGEGGMLVSKNPDLVKLAERTKSFFYDKAVNDRATPGVYDIEGFGMNLRMSEVSAAIGVEQLKKFPAFLNIRKQNYTRYLNFSEQVHRFGSFISAEVNGAEHSYYCISFLLNPEFASKRNSLIRLLKENGIGASVYYPIVLPQSKFYRDRVSPWTKEYESGFTNAERISSSSIALPVGPHVAIEDVDKVCEILKDILERGEPR